MSDRHAKNSSFSAVRVLTARVVGAVEAVASPVTERGRECHRVVALCAPFTALVLIAGLHPLSEVVRISVSTAQHRSIGFSLDAYATLFGDPYYHRVAFDSLWLTTETTLVSVGPTVPIAHALEKYDLPGEDLLVTLASFPISLPGIAVAFTILVLLGGDGVVTAVTTALIGSRPADLTFVVSVPGLFVAFVYSMMPRAALILRGTYVEVDSAVEEAAQALGATPFETFRYVMLPQVRLGIAGALTLTFRTESAISRTLIVVQTLAVWALQLSREPGVDYDMQVAGTIAAVYFAFTFLSTVLGLRYISAEVGI